MTLQILETAACSDSAVVEHEDQTALPRFTVAPFVGRKSADELKTDILLVSKLYLMDVHPTLHVQEPGLSVFVKRQIKKNFPGRSGTFLLLPLPLPNSHGSLGRQHLLVGLGTASDYTPQTVCDIFQLLIEQALELGVEHITVPFVPNPMTKQSFTHKATAYKLKETVIRVLENWDGPVKLREIELLCTPNAARHIRAALQIENQDGCSC